MLHLGGFDCSLRVRRRAVQVTIQRRRQQGATVGVFVHKYTQYIQVYTNTRSVHGDDMKYTRKR